MPEQQNCLLRHGSSTTNRHSCRTRCGGRSLLPAAPCTSCRRNDGNGHGRAVAEVTADPTTTTIARVTAITVVTAARRSLQSRQSDGRDKKITDNIDGDKGRIDKGDHGGHCGPCSGRGGFANNGRPCGTARCRWPDGLPQLPGPPAPGWHWSERALR